MTNITNTQYSYYWNTVKLHMASVNTSVQLPQLTISSSWICHTVVLHANRTVNNITKIAASGSSDFMTQTTRPHAPAAPRFDNPHDTATKKLRGIRRNELLCAGPQSLSRHEPFLVKLKCFPTICSCLSFWKETSSGCFANNYPTQLAGITKSQLFKTWVWNVLYCGSASTNTICAHAHACHQANFGEHFANAKGSWTKRPLLKQLLTSNVGTHGRACRFWVPEQMSEEGGGNSSGHHSSCSMAWEGGRRADLVQ
jgi:hypothetical protein